MKYFKITFILLSMAVFVSCASPPKNSVERKNVGKHYLYAKLVENEGNYTFADLSSSVNSNKEPWVRLNDMSPMFGIGVEKGCYLGIGLFSVTSSDKKACKSNVKKLFRTESMSGTGKFANGLFLVASFGTSGTGRLTNIVFDRESFDHAVDQALTNTKINVGDLFRTYDNLWVEWNKHKTLHQENKKKNLQAQVSIVDDSGFYKNELIDFSKLINFTPPSFTDPSTAIQAMIVNSNSPSWIKQVAHEKLYPQWEKEVSEFHVTCKHSSEKSFNFTIQCPTLISKSITETGIKKYSVKVVIHSRNFERIIPTEFKGEDQYLSASITSGSVIVKNLSNNFINLNSFSVYYKDKVATLSSLKADLPPLSEYRISLRKFLNQLPNISRKKYSSKMAAKEKIDFGFATKYKIIDLNKEKTLFKKDVFSGIHLAKY